MSDTSWSTSAARTGGAPGLRRPPAARGELLDALLPLVRGWLPQQRWFSGKGRPITDIRVLSGTELVTPAGDSSGLVHLLLRVRHLGSGAGDTYQLLISTRTTLPTALAPALIGRIDGGAHDGLMVLDAL